MNKKLLRVAMRVSAAPKPIQQAHVLVYPDGPDGEELELTVHGHVESTPAGPFPGTDRELVVQKITTPDGTEWAGELTDAQTEQVIEDMMHDPSGPADEGPEWDEDLDR